MLLGQNVNSYGNEGDLDFPDLLTEIAKIDSIKRIRFLTSHPKDLTDKLIETMAKSDKICKSLHLPFQAGNNRVLKEMNRKYTKEDYLALVAKIKKAMPNIALTSDVIVGFPTETDQEFLDTIEIVNEIRFDNLYTFIYSKRKDTKAAQMEDNKTYEEKLANFNVLLEAQTKICKEINDTYVGNTYEILDEGISKNNPDMRHGRTETNKVINYKAKSEINEGDFVNVCVTESMSWSLNGVEV
jgi:tRNA-2-methylthio-N6-dimethylallyladenosine synthase